MYFCHQRIKCGVTQTTISSQDGNYWDWHKMAALMESIESKRKGLKNSKVQLDFLEVPYLLIVLLYNISSIISSLSLSLS